MLQNHPQIRKRLHGRRQYALEEDLFPVEDVDLCVGDFAVDQQQHAAVTHGLQYRINVADVGHTGCGVGGGASRVQFGGNHARSLGIPDLRRRSGFCEVQRHQRVEPGVAGCGQYPATVSHGLFGFRHRWRQVWHDDGAAKATGGGGYDVLENVAVPHVEVPVVRTGDDQLFGHLRFRDLLGPVKREPLKEKIWRNYIRSRQRLFWRAS